MTKKMFHNFTSYDVLLRHLNKVLLIVLLAGLVAACSSSKETFIKDKKISLSTPAVIDTIRSTINIPDTTWEKIRIFIPDTTRIEGNFSVPNSKGKEKGKVTYIPKTDTFIVYIPPQTVDTTYTDTTRRVTIKEGQSLGDYLIYMIILAVVIAVILFIIKFKN